MVGSLKVTHWLAGILSYNANKLDKLGGCVLLIMSTLPLELLELFKLLNGPQDVFLIFLLGK